jgi:hypothetical protein
MGLFDYIEYEGNRYQTKNLVCALDNYIITNASELYHEQYEIEDQSDPSATGLERIVGVMTKVNKHWVKDFYTGEINFYRPLDNNEWEEYSSYFFKGRIREIHKVESNRGKL